MASKLKAVRIWSRRTYVYVPSNTSRTRCKTNQVALTTTNNELCRRELEDTLLIAVDLMKISAFAAGMIAGGVFLAGICISKFPEDDDIDTEKMQPKQKEGAEILTRPTDRGTSKEVQREINVNQQEKASRREIRIGNSGSIEITDEPQKKEKLSLDERLLRAFFRALFSE